MVNAAGFDAHKRSEYEVSRAHFHAAVGLDPANHTARYNMACAEARLGDATGAVRQLKGLPATAELRDKITGDADFETIREDPLFLTFLETLERG